jgi:hypothetical protein
VSGFQEILVIVLIVLAIIFVPRIRKPPETASSASRRSAAIAPLVKGRMRLAIFISLLWLGITAFFFQPWGVDLMRFLYLGLGPPALCWGIFWVIKGFQKERRSL